MGEEVETVCIKCVPEDFDWEGLYEFKLCGKHTETPVGSEDILVTAKKKRLVGFAESESETNRAWSEWQKRIRRRH